MINDSVDEAVHDEPVIDERRLRVSKNGTVTLSALHRRFKLYVGSNHAGEQVIVAVAAADVTARSCDGHVLAEYQLDPNRSYLKRINAYS